MVYNTKLFGIKLFAFLLMIAVLTGQYIGGTSKVYAAETDTKAATLTDIKVSFNGAEPVTIQAYAVDGNNYVRARDITDGVNMEVNPILNGKEVGIYIVPENPAEKTAPMEILTAQTANIELMQGEISFGGMPYEAQCFNLNNRYYYKVDDIFAAADYSLNSWVDLVKLQAGSAFAQSPSLGKFSSISIELNENADVIKINRTEHDFVKMFNEIRGGVMSEAPEIKASYATPANAQYIQPQPEIKKAAVPTDTTVKSQPPLTQAPEIGSQPANILKDIGVGAYTKEGYPNRENLQVIYNKPVSIGQCTWYAACRFEEVTGIDVVNAKAPNTLYDTDVPKWVDAAVNGKCPNLIGINEKKSIVAQSIAVWDSHVVFVEYVEYDKNGNPKNIYFTEANGERGEQNGQVLHDGTYYPNFDGKVIKLSFDEFFNRHGRTLIGYIAAK